jgi:hypothetical protein
MKISSHVRASRREGHAKRLGQRDGRVDRLFLSCLHLLDGELSSLHQTGLAGTLEVDNPYARDDNGGTLRE